MAAPLVFGKYNPRFSYWIDVDRISTKRVRIVAGLGDFVKKVLPLLNLDI
ncbi:hypothetical protein [Pyrobaculum aerophilum]|nr:hypothetical protein [Pyrobaculum aerophilum]